MKLKNNFSQKTRNLYLYSRNCWVCGRSDKGLEIHHVFGRVSKSPFNAAVVCLECHSHMGHSQEERRMLLRRAVRFLAREKYEFTKEDTDFLRTVKGDFDWAVHNLI